MARDSKQEVLPGTLTLLILKTLATLGPLHGYGIARRIEQVSGDLLELNDALSRSRQTSDKSVLKNLTVVPRR